MLNMDILIGQINTLHKQYITLAVTTAPIVGKT